MSDGAAFIIAGPDRIKASMNTRYLIFSPLFLTTALPYFHCVCCPAENVPVRNSDVDYRLLEAAKAGDLDTVKVVYLHLLMLTVETGPQ